MILALGPRRRTVWNDRQDSLVFPTKSRAIEIKTQLTGPVGNFELPQILGELCCFNRRHRRWTSKQERCNKNACDRILIPIHGDYPIKRADDGKVMCLSETISSASVVANTPPPL
eukprot:752489-Hanusia_phi.AAC.2